MRSTDSAFGTGDEKVPIHTKILNFNWQCRGRRGRTLVLVDLLSGVIGFVSRGFVFYRVPLEGFNPRTSPSLRVANDFVPPWERARLWPVFRVLPD
jgi:hypothetical protein